MSIAAQVFGEKPYKVHMTKQKLTLGGLICFPIITFYTLLSRELVNLPFLDDYGAVLGFLNQWTKLHSTREKSLYVLTAQHNEYKTMFANAIFVMQYKLLGHVNFIILGALGNAFVLLLFVVLYKMWMLDGRTINNRLFLFIPSAWILFQLQYYGTLNFPSAGLQNVPILFFSFLTIYLLSRRETGAFYFAILSLALAIATSGNGIFLVPIGSLMLIQFRRLARLVPWLLVSGGMLAIYFYRYNFSSSQANPDHSTISSIHRLSLTYALSFMGSSIARYQSYVAALVLGICLCAILIFAVTDKFYLKSPAIFYSILFILVTALAVSAIRSSFGMTQSLASRYRIYSNLLVILTYFYVAGWLQKYIRGRAIRFITIGMIATMVAVFNVASNRAGYTLLGMRKIELIDGMRRLEHGESPVVSTGEVNNENPVISRQRADGIFVPNGPILETSASLHIYVPPVF
jgi:hypothetical protein